MHQFKPIQSITSSQPATLSLRPPVVFDQNTRLAHAESPPKLPTQERPMTPTDWFDIPPEDLNREVIAYRDARARRLTSERGWLTLIGKVWLPEGPSRIGARADCEIQLPPEAAPPLLGHVTLKNGVVHFDAEPSAEVFARGQRVSSVILRSDVDAGPGVDDLPDELVSGSLTLQLIRRGDEFAIRVRDSQSPLRRSFAGIPAYPITPEWRIVADWEPFASEKPVIYPDSEGRPQSYLSPGVAVFERERITCRLEPVLENDRNRLFLLFADASNRDQTYGAGRFLYLPLPRDGRVVLDFNKAFNPPCAFTPYAACPLPPRENQLTLRVEAGERRPAGQERPAGQDRSAG
jgi:uncharacterized protein (DUF1684 family)